MNHSTVILVTLIIYKIVLIAIGIAASGRNKNETDYYLGGRAMGPWVASLSASASSSSAWTLLGVSGAAYAWGLSAIWIFPACLSGFLINWFLLAPGLRRLSLKLDAVTVTDILVSGKSDLWRSRIAGLASFIILFSILFYVASQFQGSGKTFQGSFSLTSTQSILLGSAIIMFYTMLGGFWAVSITDSLQGMVMAVTALLLPIGAFVAVGGSSEFVQGLQGVEGEGFSSLFQDMTWPAAFGFIFGLMGIGLGYPGQPHVVNRFMALKDEASVLSGRRIAIIWAIIVYSGMIILGLCGRILYPDLADAEMVFLAVANEHFHPVLAGVMIAGVLSATMSTADSQLLVAASAITRDLPWFSTDNPVRFSRMIVVFLSLGAVLVALFGNNEIFSKVLFAWTAIGSAFGPLLLTTVFKGPVRGKSVVIAMALGFGLSVLAYSFPATKGTYWERVAPFIVSFIIAWLGADRRESLDSSD